MKISTNLDLNKDFKDEVYKGFDWREIGYAAAGAVIIIISALACGLYLAVPPQMCIFIGCIPALPVFFMGFYKIQNMTVMEYFKEYVYDRLTEELYYEADEIPKNTEIWTMQSESGKEGKHAFYKKRKKV